VAINVGSRAEVDAALADAVAAGGTVPKAAAATEWGGYSGYFADPDGHLWEVAHNPFWPLDERGLPQLP
jgi:predicted lactoylglutathione lyase